MFTLNGYVGVAAFRRTRECRWEPGFYINERVLVDAEGNWVVNPHEVVYTPHLGCFMLPDADALNGTD